MASSTLMMQCVHCRCCCSSSSPKPPPENWKFDNREQKLDEIENSPKHRLTLQDWQAQLATSSNNLVRKLSSISSSTSDLYQILGLFFVFEGVVITAVAQASAVKCHNSWLIFTLSTLVSVATLFASIQKLREIAEAKRIYLEEKTLCSSLFNSIEMLKEEGLQFDLVAGQPNLGNIYANRKEQSLRSISERIHSFWKTWVRSYAGAVFFFLLAFSGVTLAAVHLIVCDPQRNK